MHSALLQSVVDGLMWLQLAWVLAGFALMAWLAFRIFPYREQKERARNIHAGSETQTMVLGGYRFEGFPTQTLDS
jgi:hypothetical protein